MPRRTSKPADKPVVLSRIYTGVGDDGTTMLGDMSKAAKTDPRLAAYADVDEANCAIGTAIALGDLPAEVAGLLTRVQNELFDVGADLCRPLEADGSAGGGADGGGEGTAPGGKVSALRITGGYVTGLERECDRYNEGLAVLRSFVLPGGTAGAALLHTARAVVRRAERSAWAAIEAHGDSINPLAARYLNRLSDLLFILARRANGDRGDVLWKPGGDR
jgi:cob(I)alamin adenosyltransferase